MIKTIRKIAGAFIGRVTVTSVEMHTSRTCSECGSRFARNLDADGAHTDWHCPNPDCPPQVLKRVALWASPEAMDIQGCDAALVAQLVNRGLVSDAADFYRLKVGEIAALEGMSKDAAQKFFDSITASMKRDAWRVLFGLGIPTVGATEAQALCRSFPTLDGLFAAGRERIAKSGRVSETVARNIADWFADPVNRKLVRRLEKAGVNFKTTAV
ncbi:MAG: hypothetical protein HOP33_15175 [Verrucomicrobia bacterium]|nr:hypothetical protein [Verrucomicrobiota bacterium]